MKIENIIDDIKKDIKDLSNRFEEQFRKENHNLDFTISLPDIDELATIKTVALTIKQEDEIFFLSVLVHTHNGNRVFENCSKIMLNNKAKCYGKRHPLQDRFVDLLRDLIKRKKNKTRASNKPAKLLGQLQQYASDL